MKYIKKIKHGIEKGPSKWFGGEDANLYIIIIRFNNISSTKKKKKHLNMLKHTNMVCSSAIRQQYAKLSFISTDLYFSVFFFYPFPFPLLLFCSREKKKRKGNKETDCIY
jgi:hypothetical protein